MDRVQSHFRTQSNSILKMAQHISHIFLVLLFKGRITEFQDGIFNSLSRGGGLKVTLEKAMNTISNSLANELEQDYTNSISLGDAFET